MWMREDIYRSSVCTKMEVDGAYCTYWRIIATTTIREREEEEEGDSLCSWKEMTLNKVFSEGPVTAFILSIRY